MVRVVREELPEELGDRVPNPLRVPLDVLDGLLLCVVERVCVEDPVFERLDTEVRELVGLPLDVRDSRADRLPDAENDADLLLV